jgi:hypothetical protein
VTTGRWRMLLQRGWPYAAALLILPAVFAMYLQPEFMMTLALQLWACF